MYKKMFILLFCLIMLISLSAVSAADLDDNNETLLHPTWKWKNFPHPMMLMQWTN